LKQVQFVSSKTILIVDDSPDNREVYGLFLQHFGYTILTASDGWDGVQQARSHHPDLILMDISMPVLDGLEATELLKIDAETQAIPVIAITAHDDSSLRSRAHAIGFESYLTKPAQPRRILQEVERCLGNGSPMGNGSAMGNGLSARAPREDRRPFAR
jgi:two-component system, cell cycle response regulator DivK